ncbi:hypothetical protein [Winogradskyella aurantia]|uniref:Lipocalin-like domain-containing protein n=1 Tax=Winogradskyella aurantia TaxID=1915063 RepID=A0A265UUR2_9FLAO|nr:hypothetical protein [Winogradskyella aurantia]OZV69048.1 hypothetical protein CA834_06180 [Winogradskyella aurantia]
MKKRIYTVLISTIMVVLLQSCNNDDDTVSLPDLNNEISIDGTIYSIAGPGILQSYGENSDGSFDRDIEIFAEDLFVEFDLNTPSVTGVSEGTYTFSATREAVTFFSVEIDNNSDIFYSPQLGTVVVSVNGDTTTVTFNLTAQDGTAIRGQWNGTLQ